MSANNQKLSEGAGPTNEEGKADYVVGRCRPPKEFQFRPGQSGNPRGRPKRTLSFAPELADGLHQLLPDESGITNKQAIVNTVMAAARKNAKLGFALMDFCEKYGRHQEDPVRPMMMHLWKNSRLANQVHPKDQSVLVTKLRT